MLKEIKDGFREEWEDFKVLCKEILKEEGILVLLARLFLLVCILLVLLPLVLLCLPFWLFNDWSKTWVKEGVL